MSHTPSLLIRKPKPETEKTLFAIFYFYLHQTLNGHLGPSERPPKTIVDHLRARYLVDHQTNFANALQIIETTRNEVK